jgi:hypothetical protein
MFTRHLARKTAPPVTPPSVIDTAGDAITDPNALAFHHTVAKFEKTQGHQVLFPRASSLFDACMRMHVIAAKSDIKYYKTESGRPQDTMVFNLGTAVHYMMQNTPTFFGDRRIGFWECSACGTIIWGKPPIQNCDRCGAKKEAFVYIEHGFTAEPPYYCSGHVDLFLDVGNGKSRMLDLKTMGEDEFYGLEAVKAKDEFQLLTYMVLAEAEADLPIDTNRGFIFYVCKKIKSDAMPYKMFHVIRNESNTNSVLKRLALFKNGYENFPNDLPPVQPSCLGFTSYAAKSCPCVSACVQLACSEGGR